MIRLESLAQMRLPGRFIVRVAHWGSVRAAHSSLFAIALALGLSAQTTPERAAARAAPTSTLAASQLFDAGSFLPDPHQGGGASALHLVEVVWGRLVDVHAIDASGATSARPVYVDLVVNENVQSDGANYRLESSPGIQRTRLVILRVRGAPQPSPGAGTFEELLAAATADLPALLPAAAGAPPPFSLVPRNAVLMARFDDLLDDDAASAAALSEHVRVIADLSSGEQFPARVVFDPNHGGLAGGRFHSTRVLIDVTVSELEAAAHSQPLPVNLLGLPPSPLASAGASFELRFPARLVPAVGQFSVLTNLAGRPLALQPNAPFESGDIVRAARAGNAEDSNRGFLLDLDRPQLVGTFPATLDGLTAVGALELQASLTLTSTCRQSLRTRDVLVAGSAYLEVLDPGSGPTPGGSITGARLRALHPRPLGNPAALLGQALLLTPYDPSSQLPAACWLGFSPAGSAPGAGISPFAQVTARFSEPIEPASVVSYDSFRIVAGGASTPAESGNLVVGETSGSVNLDTFVFTPLLPFAHAQGSSETYHVELAPAGAGPGGELFDLAGNTLAATPAAIEFSLAAQAPSERSRGVVLRFASPDELAPLGFPDLRGQFLYDFSRGLVRGREVEFTSHTIDRTVPVPSIMIPIPSGVNTPLVPLGSKLQAVWRYVDVGWNVRDERFYNVDVAGLAWAPVGGQVRADFYPDFEIRLAHSVKQPDEDIDNNLLPEYPESGLFGSPNPFTSNILVDPLSPQKVVHPRSAGYSINPANLYTAPTGTRLLPYPLNRGSGPLVTYTWRDTAVLAVGAPNGAGIPLDIEAGAPLFLEPAAGTVAPSGSVPSFGLPLLIEYRCYPDATAIGLNALDVSIAINSSAKPNFRAFSSGGFNSQGFPVVKDPDLQPVPTGGLNPFSSPPGQPTLSADDVFYIGELDLVTRVSRAHSIWIDTGTAAPDYAAALLDVDARGSSATVVAEYRGASGFTGAGNAPFDASMLDPYGDFAVGSVSFFGGTAAWTSDLSSLDGARYLQVRLTFVNDLARQETADLASLALAFQD
jgi:hypothetical protein